MKKIFLLLSILCSTLTLSAGPIGEARARQIAEEFFSQHTTRSASGGITLTWAGDIITEPIATDTQLDNALMYIYSRGTNDGFVVVAGDSNVTPIIAYSLNSTIDINDMADATRDILDAWCKQINAAREEQIPISNTRSVTRSSDELLYETALWNQGEPYNREAPVIEGYKTITGCVATAMSIICHYNRWPERGIGTTPEYSYYDGYDRLQTIPANTLGRVYNYDNMLLDYNYGYTDTEANAVAALMKDMGTSVKMMYYTNKSGESGAFDINVGVALTTYFQYSKSARVTRRDSYPIEEWNALVRENLRNCGPMYYSGGNGVGGHAFVVDGYTANDYFHFNFGWGGSSNGWYQIPNIAFYLNQLTILGLTPDRDNSSTYSDSIYLVSLYDDTGIVYRGMHTEATRYEYGQTYDFHIGGIYNYGTRTYNGNIAIVHCNRNDVWKSVLGEYTINDMGIESFTYFDTPLTITENIEAGDCIRMFYRSSDSDDWMLMRRFSTSDVDKIKLCAYPDEVAKEIKFAYDKITKFVVLTTSNALQYVIETPTSTYESECKSYDSISFTATESGEYRLTLASGGEPYILKLKL